jgi:hypothetical protein
MLDEDVGCGWKGFMLVMTPLLVGFDALDEDLE